MKENGGVLGGWHESDFLGSVWGTYGFTYGCLWNKDEKKGMGGT
jgi:hypothetical protein